MIRLTLNAQSDPEIHLFNKPIILIGSESGHVDLVLSDPDIQPIHLKIVEQNGFLILVNYANDPFVSVNGHPFGRKLLNSGDVILIHQTTILFETIKSSNKGKELNSEFLAPILENKIQKQYQVKQQSPVLEGVPFSLPFEEGVETLRGQDWHDNIEGYLKELEVPEKKSHLSSSIKEQNERKTLKDDYLKDLDDNENENNPFDYLSEPSHLYQAWKWILIFIFSLFSIAAIIGSIIYFSVSDKTEAQETKAAQGVADIAIALTHAQLTHLKPHNHNWSDVDFLKSNLQTILPETLSHAFQIDAQGQFHCCPYSLRIYTSSDLSHFLLIAQPAPSLLYWLIPKSIIVVDSHLMELRTLKDIRSLNRLLANPDPLDGVNGKEITNLIKQGELIRLANLANESGHLDFAPPKNLGWIHPGAEHLIYNAPRYYRLGQHLIQQAITLSTSKVSSQEVTTFKQEVENFSSLNHLILYADQGKKMALLTKQGLMMFAPSDKFLFGYLLFNAQGKIHQVYLLKDDEEGKETFIANSNKENDTAIAFQPLPDIELKEDVHKKDVEQSTVDHNHPIYIQLYALVTARENELKPLNIALMNLMNRELQTPYSQFQFEFQTLSHIYLMAEYKYTQTLREALDNLYEQYENVPVHQFLAFIKELNLEQLIQPKDQTLNLVDESCQQNIENLLVQIDKSKSLNELDNLVHIACSWLTFDYIKNPQDLIKYQNLLRNQLLEQLEKYLFSPKKHLVLKPEDRELLQHILNQERLINFEEKEFFIAEFDALITSPQISEANEK